MRFDFMPMLVLTVSLGMPVLQALVCRMAREARASKTWVPKLELGDQRNQKSTRALCGPRYPLRS